jgi:DtxR family transcriptional regulator, Mn-dependent transcriptional regulator
MNLSDLTRAEVAYLQTMYRLNESDDIASVSVLARKFDVRPPTAIEILRKLQAKGLVVQKPWKVPELSTRGMAIAESIIHQHRIVELYLNTTLGLSSQTSCDEATKIDYLLDMTVIEKMCRALNRPTKCLHGNPIKHQEH